ncbi:MAG TPA: tripartite tricarboxylate transporter permease, partial [Paracoccaceae bacterium]|nr:tripartite tricarboxylate transporter permease [Paracoccaceae bacterium]
VPALTLLLAIYAVTTTGDTLSAVLLGVPGTAASAATVIDGYPMAQRGEAERAFGAAFTVSMMGGVLGGVILALSLPIIRPVILQFASPEFFMLGVLGLTMVGALSGASMLKGLAAACLGLLASMVGYAPASPVPRYWFDQIFLLEGLPMIAVVLGLFALPEIMELALRNRSIAKVPQDQSAGGGTRQGIRDALTHWWLVLRCSAIGVYIGMLPGLGASIVDWVAYGHTVQSAKGETKFGQGDIRGVIGPESANNAVRGGALIPTVAFGIPGSASMAILLGALLIQGIRPGQEMLTEKLDITYSMVWTIILANILAALILLRASRQIARLAFVPGHFIVPAVVALVLMGSWLELAHIGGWGVLLLFAFVGIWMKYAGWPRPPLLLGFILGPIMESGYRLSTRAYGGLDWLTRPFVLVFLAIIVLTLVLKLRTQIRLQKVLKSHGAPVAATGEG